MDIILLLVIIIYVLVMGLDQQRVMLPKDNSLYIDVGKLVQLVVMKIHTFMVIKVIKCTNIKF